MIFKTFLSLDVKANDTLDIKINELHKNCHFFLPLIGQEKAVNIVEGLVILRQQISLLIIYDFILRDNPNSFKKGKSKHGLNIFFTRLLFCFFSEDTEIFNKGSFTKSIH